jgi:hypothetical protein
VNFAILFGAMKLSEQDSRYEQERQSPQGSLRPVIFTGS